VEGEERLRGEAEGVGDGEADAAVADVESQNTGGEGAGGCLHGDSVRPALSRPRYPRSHP
jgi:hypothetical protein